MADSSDRRRIAAPARIRARLPALPALWKIAVAVPLIVLAGIAVALVSQVWEVKGELQSAQHLVPDLEQQLRDGDLAGAEATAAELADHSGRAAATSAGALWRAGEWLPVLGDDLGAVRVLADAMHITAARVAHPLLAAAAGLDDSALPRDGAVDLRPLVAMVPVVERADAALAEALALVAGADTGGTIAEISDAKQTLGDALTALRPVVDTANELAPMVPALLGADGPRQYAVMFQNNAESRALGGTALAFVVVGVDGGRISVGAEIPTSSSGFGSGDPLIDVPPELAALYENAYGTHVANASVRPSFSGAAQTVIAGFARYKNIAVDGVLSIDPVALGYLLRATGPIPLPSGDTLSADSAVPLLLNTVYERYASGTGDWQADDALQDAFYAEAVAATADRLLGGDVRLPELADALRQGWSERRILFSSAHDEEQERLAAVGLNGELPVSDDTTDRFGVYLQENLGSKLTYFSSQKVQLGRALCREDSLASYRVTLELGNTLDPARAPFISDPVAGFYRAAQYPKGQQRMLVYLYAPPGSVVERVTVDGVAVAPGQFADGAYPVDRQRVEIPAGATATFVYDVVAARPGDRALEAQVTPMVSPTQVDTVPLDCGDIPH